MSKNNLNLNNKFGECCRCPALTNRDILFTNYLSSKIFESNVQNNLAMNSHGYRHFLQTKSNDYIKMETDYLSKNKCTNNNKNKFYIDTSKYDFSTNLINDYQGPMMQNHYTKKSERSVF
jgi:hypothetical protein